MNRQPTSQTPRTLAICTILAAAVTFGAAAIVSRPGAGATPTTTTPLALGEGARLAVDRTVDRTVDRVSRDAGRAADVHAAASITALDVKLRDGATLALAGNGLTGTTSAEDNLTLAIATALGDAPGARLEPLFRLDRAELTGLRRDAELRSHASLPDLGQWYHVAVPAGTDAAALERRLAALPQVESVSPSPVGAPLPTADYSGRQGYRLSAPAGIDAAAASRLPGGTGDRVKIIDVEYSWNTRHEDLAAAASGFIANGTFVDPYADTNHGTAVLGELIGTPNGFGVTGIAPGAAIGMVNANNRERGYDVSNAIILAAKSLQPGDVLLIEQQLSLPNTDKSYVPVEYYQAPFDAIRYATARGIIVVEAGGNGSNDLDALGVGATDSGAIMVGAGQVAGCGGDPNDGPARSRAWFSNYGRRIDVQASGECVMTTGYGNFYNGGQNAWYTATFGGTSSASPIVAGAAAILSSVIEARTGVAATPSQVRNLLKTTGTPQDLSTGTLRGAIGPMPNIAKAIDALGAGSGGGTGGTVDVTAPVVSSPKQAGAVGFQLTPAGLVPTTISWSATDPSGIARYAVKVSTDAGAWADVTLPSATATSVALNLTLGSSYRFIVAARDGAGNWSEWQTGPTFRPTFLAETSTSIAYAGSWSRAAWSEAAGGYVAVSSQAGATATITFTGRSISWVASQSTNRGTASVTLDGVNLGTVDLYRATTLARSIVFSKAVATGTTHTLVIRVLGTDGRPKVDLDGIVILG